MIAVTAQVGSNWRREQLDMLNNLRTQHGVRQLNYHHRLELAAQRHVDDLSRAGVPASHIGTDGSTVDERAERAGYRWLRIGENAARGQRHVEGAMRSFTNSPTHFRNMIGQHWVDVGFGFNSNGNYWCQVFGTPRASRQLGNSIEDYVYDEEDFVFVSGRMDEINNDWLRGYDGTAFGEALSDTNSEEGNSGSGARLFLPCQRPSFTQSIQCSQVPMTGNVACTVYNLFDTCNLCGRCY